MSEDMVKDGYQDIMNIDVSSVAVHMMSRKYEGLPQLKCIWFLLLSSFFLSDIVVLIFLDGACRYADGC